MKYLSKMITIEVNEQDAPAIERILKELEFARTKWPTKWIKIYEREKKALILEESIELIQAINDCDKEHAKLEAAQYAVTAIRYLTGN
jgi:hypothetical protein